MLAFILVWIVALKNNTLHDLKLCASWAGMITLFCLVAALVLDQYLLTQALGLAILIFFFSFGVLWLISQIENPLFHVVAIFLGTPLTLFGTWYAWAWLLEYFS